MLVLQRLTDRQIVECPMGENNKTKARHILQMSIHYLRKAAAKSGKEKARKEENSTKSCRGRKELKRS